LNENSETILGAWEDLPRRNFDVDATAVELDSRDAFVLTRIDGGSTVADLCSITGLGERDTLKHLTRLVELKLVVLDEGSGKRRLIHLRSRHKSEGPVPEAEVAPFRGVSREDSAWLKQFGSLGLVPGVQRRGVGKNRHGGLKFDQDLLKEADFLTVEFKKEVIFLYTFLGKMDHFEFFAAAATDDRKAIRKAYFEFSRRFHPDTVFRRDVGPFRDRIERIFKHGTELYELLTSNAAFRERYAKAVNARNELIHEETANQRVAQKKAHIGRLKKQTTSRKEALRERLRQNTEARSTLSREKHVGERLDKAKQFYDEGMAHYENEGYMAAANSLRLASNYDPKNGEYSAALALAEEKMRQHKAETQWKRGYIQESLGHISEALQAYLEAAEVLPRPDYCAHIAELFLKYDQDLHKAEELAVKAVEGDPRNVEFKLILGRIYQHAKLTKKATTVFERVLELDSRNEEAKQALKKLK
jgi:tetratricopeptide (TPR) repeat protein